MQFAQCRYHHGNPREEYMRLFLPAMLLQFPMVALGSALRATGIIKPTVILQILSVITNMILAPLLIFGWFGFPRSV